MGIILLIFSCKEAPIITPPYEEIVAPIVQVDTFPPQINWISPRFDAVVNEIISIKCEVTDTSGVASVDLFVDNINSGISNSNTSDSTYEFVWQTTSYSDGSEPQLSIRATDNKGNDTTSQFIRVIVDNNRTYPQPVQLYAIDSIFTEFDDIFTGYKLSWNQFNGSYFAKYILQRSDGPNMVNSSTIFSTTDILMNEYEDNYTTSSSIIYYRVIVENIFDKKTPGDVISTSMINMPPTWDIHSVNYTSSSLSVYWSNLTMKRYLSHQLIHSNKRDGEYELLESFSDSSVSHYQSFDFIPKSENWFSIYVEDTLGQISMGQPFKHPYPQEPFIDSVLYNNHTFTIHWAKEPDEDFTHYEVLQSDNENPYDLVQINLIENRLDTSLTITDIIENNYYLYQILTKDAWELETRGQVVIASSFFKFNKKIGGVENDNLYSVIPRPDGGYIGVGTTYNQGAWLVKISSLGLIEDSLYYGESNSGFRDVEYISDGGFILTGFSMIDEKESILVLKTNDVGDQEWLNIFTDIDNTGSNAIVSLSNGNLGLTGYSINNNQQDIFVMTLDSDGNELWKKTVGGSKSDVGHDILALDNGSLMVLGVTHSSGDDDGDIWLLEFDSDGNSIDTLLIQLDGKQIGYSFRKTEFGDYVIGGITSGNSGVTDVLLLKIDELGEVKWEFNYGGIYNDRVYSLIASDGGWVLAGQTYSFDSGGGDILLLKVGDFGEVEWDVTIGGNSQDTANDIKLSLDGGFIISGSTYRESNSDGWLIKTDSRGNFKGMLNYP